MWALLVAGLALGCASIPTEHGVLHPGLRVMAVCPTAQGTEVLAYPISGTFAGMNVVLGAVLGAAIGTAVAPGVGTAAGAGGGALVGGLVELASSVRGGPDPMPSCPTGTP